MESFNFHSLKPFIFSHALSWKDFDLSLKPCLYDCLKLESLEFFNLLYRLDDLAFGGQGMGMERWTFFDCGAMPGGIFGFALEKEKLPDSFLKKMKVPSSYKGLVPISMFIAIPTVQKSTWFGHNLSSFGREIGIKGLGLKTKAYGLISFQIEEMYGATQWGSPAIAIHSRLSEMKLLSSYTPIHSHPNSFTYYSEYSKTDLLKSLDKRREPRQSTERLGESDTKRQREIQEMIENGEKFIMVAAPEKREDGWVYPILNEK